jgi:ParB family transcriptional regulator, chromosome partitioning protein
MVEQTRIIWERPPPPIVPESQEASPVLSALFSSESVEWYTPKKFIEAVRSVLGGIDLDPASCAQANSVVGAARYYTNEDDGLSLPWYGKVFLNPPYGKEGGKSNQEKWSRRLIDEFTAGRVSEAILLVNASTETLWFQPLWAYPLCFVRGRIDFWRPNGNTSHPTHGSVFVYFGRKPQNFLAAFRTLGVVAQAVDG